MIDSSFLQNDRDRERPLCCPECNGEYDIMGRGEYRCKSCGNIFYDDFGKINKFLTENGPATAFVIYENTGVPIHKINAYLKQGRLEIPDGGSIYIRCEKCGAEIRFGRVCPECAMKLSKNVQGIDVGERPLKKGKGDGEMHFLKRKN